MVSTMPTIQDRKRAIDSYRQLFIQFPDSLDYGLRLADEQRWVNPADALHTLETLRHLPLPASDDPRIDYLEARAWVNNDVVKAQAAARRAIEKGNAQGLQLFVARATEFSVRSAMAIPPPKTVMMLERVTQRLAIATMQLAPRPISPSSTMNRATWIVQKRCTGK